MKKDKTMKTAIWLKDEDEPKEYFQCLDENKEKCLHYKRKFPDDNECVWEFPWSDEYSECRNIKVYNQNI